MFVILVNNSIEDLRDNKIKSITGVEISENYLQLVSKRYMSTPILSKALTFKTKSGVERAIKSYESWSAKEKNSYSYDSNLVRNTRKYFIIKGKKLTYRRLRKEEWNMIIDEKVIELEKDFQRKKEKLINKKKC